MRLTQIAIFLRATWEVLLLLGITAATSTHFQCRLNINVGGRDMSLAPDEGS